MKDVDVVKDIETFNDKSENLTSVPTAGNIPIFK